MPIQDKAGIEKMVYDATAGAVNLLAEHMNTDFSTVIDKLTTSTARGTERPTGNKSVDFTFMYFDTSVRSAIESDEGDLNSLEIWQLGSTSADETIPDVELIVQDSIEADPDADQPSGLEIQVRRTWYAG